MNATIRAITFDLDDTLWPFAPIGERIETALHAWFIEHSPRTAERFPISEMRHLRERVFAQFPEHAHDLGLLRRLTIERALKESGDDPALASAAYAIFFRERNRVDFYPDAMDCLRRIAARLPVAALTNGNADLAAIGIAGLFRFQLGGVEQERLHLSAVGDDRSLWGQQLVRRRKEVQLDFFIRQVWCLEPAVAIKFVIALPDGLAVLAVGVPHL